MIRLGHVYTSRHSRAEFAELKALQPFEGDPVGVQADFVIPDPRVRSRTRGPRAVLGDAFGVNVPAASAAHCLSGIRSKCLGISADLFSTFLLRGLALGNRVCVQLSLFGNFHFHEEQNYVHGIEKGREKRGASLRGQEAGHARQGAMSAGSAGVSIGGSGAFAAAGGEAPGMLAADGAAGDCQNQQVDCDPGSGPGGGMDLGGTVSSGGSQTPDHARA